MPGAGERAPGLVLTRPQLVLTPRALREWSMPTSRRRPRLPRRTSTDPRRGPRSSAVRSSASWMRKPARHRTIEFAYGEHLRRARATGEARVHLTRALDGFGLLGARPWQDKA